MINEVLEGFYQEQLPTEQAMSDIYVWLRYSSTRQLTWQRNYNTQPRILSAAQERLTKTIAEAHRRTVGEAQEWVRMMLTTVGRGGDGQKIRDEILHIMHRSAALPLMAGATCGRAPLRWGRHGAWSACSTAFEALWSGAVAALERPRSLMHARPSLLPMVPSRPLSAWQGRRCDSACVRRVPCVCLCNAALPSATAPRHHIPERKGTWMEEWHQKLHNNTTPDDVPICQAYISFLEVRAVARAGGARRVQCRARMRLVSRPAFSRRDGAARVAARAAPAGQRQPRRLLARAERRRHHSAAPRKLRQTHCEAAEPD